jgi:hypothetical protein
MSTIICREARVRAAVPLRELVLGVALLSLPPLYLSPSSLPLSLLTTSPPPPLISPLVLGEGQIINKCAVGSSIMVSSVVI